MRTATIVILGATAFGLAVGIPVSLAIASRPAPVPAVIESVSATPSQTPSSSKSATAGSTPAEAAATVHPATTPPPAPVAVPQPQGTIALTVWHDHGADNRCVAVETIYENRSDTALNTVTQVFVTMYTPKHANGTYPALKDGPTKSMTQTVGIPPYGTRTIGWNVCAHELVAKQNPPPADGVDGYLEEIGARPTSFTWDWVR